MIIVGTDVPLSARQLVRVAKRAAFGLARTGATAAHGSGDFVIAFSSGKRISAAASSKQSLAPPEFIPEPQLSSLFRAVIEATEEAIINSILKAETMAGRDGNTRVGIPIERVIAIISKY
jgi:D-aminopeptidase